MQNMLLNMLIMMQNDADTCFAPVLRPFFEHCPGPELARSDLCQNDLRFWRPGTGQGDWDRVGQSKMLPMNLDSGPPLLYVLHLDEVPALAMRTATN